ncbi:hypothetical protein KCP75_11340 [Salmonella enterica subsp. enterica]|nr:hypothetical protein KCP75_11340 [Salmonella enterica subsp. enterica]
MVDAGDAGHNCAGDGNGGVGLTTHVSALKSGAKPLLMALALFALADYWRWRH